MLEKGPSEQAEWNAVTLCFVGKRGQIRTFRLSSRLEKDTL